MARQKSESRMKPQSQRKLVLTRGHTGHEGGIATPVNEQTRECHLHFATAEECSLVQSSEVDGGAVSSREATATRAMLMAECKRQFSSRWQGTREAHSAQEKRSRTRGRPGTGRYWDRRGREPASGEGHNSSFRRAVCEQHLYGSVGAGAGNRPGYPIIAEERSVACGCYAPFAYSLCSPHSPYAFVSTR